MSHIEVVSIHPIESSLANCHLQLDYPQAGGTIPGHVLDIEGWIIGKSAPVEHLEVWHGQRLLRRTEVHIRRPDVNNAIAPSLAGNPVTWAKNKLLGWLRQSVAKSTDRVGFQCSFPLIGLPTHLELLVLAKWANQAAVEVAKIQLCRGLVSLPCQPALQPIVVTAAPRSGTSWLMRLLSEHPEIVVHMRHPYESCVGLHAISCLLPLVSTGAPCPRQWRDLEEHPGKALPLPVYCRHEDQPTHDWLRKDYVERMAASLLDTVDGFYNQVAKHQGKVRLRYYAEKPLVHLPYGLVTASGELYSGMRELFLIRDFRDAACSHQSYFDMSLAKSLQRATDMAQKLWQRWLERRGKAHLVRYEDLVRQPETTLQAILKYLGLDDGTESARLLLESTRSNWAQQDGHRTVSDPIKSIGRWRREWAPVTQKQFADHCQEPLQGFGYLDAA